MGQVEYEIPNEYITLIDSIAAENQRHYNFRLKRSPLGERILGLDREEQRLLVMAMVFWLDNGGHHAKRLGEKVVGALHQALKQDHAPLAPNDRRLRNVREAMLELLRRKLPFNHDDIVKLLNWSGNQKYAYQCGASQMIKVVENYLKEHSLTPEIQSKIEGVATKLESGYNNADMRRQAAKLRELGELRGTALPLIEGEVWSDAVILDLESVNSDIRAKWEKIIELCLKTSGSKPTQKWTESAHALLDEIGFSTFKQSILKWFPLVDKPRTQIIEAWNTWQPDPNQLIHETNADILKGFVWLCSIKEDRDVARLLTALAISAYRKIASIGPRCVKVGNACVWALGQMPGLAGVGQLALLKTRVKFGTAQKGIEKALTTAAEREGVSKDEIEEMVVPDYDMKAVGLRQEHLGEFVAELTVTGTASTELRWIKPDGKSQKSVPKSIKENHAEQLKALKQAANDIRKMIPAQRDRIDSLYLQQKTWGLATWRERYLDHPLVGTLSRRIIWQFTDGDHSESGIWYEGQIVGPNGFPLDWLNGSTTVKLWHPIDQPAETVVAWRNWLVEHLVQQPFKQAHREIYLLTDAERQTDVYSNRFAAHIIKQHQFNALCGARGWRNKLRLMVDDTYSPAMRLLPAWGLRAEFWIEGIGDNYGTDTTEAGTYLYLTTDQVRFYSIDAPQNSAHAWGGGYHLGYGWAEPGQPIPLEEIPPLVFTEIMRDVDLFVGVASIGNDPNWLDGGPEVQYRAYWHTYSFGELSETAKTRKETLERLIPSLKIADLCELTDRFLIVHGHMRTYKIHLGSGNILMTPNDQYLCIVPARGSANPRGTGKVFLPFEGDNTMAVILSKAFLLAEDKAIKDSTILRQIKI